MKYWEIIADNLKKRGWFSASVSAVDSDGPTIWITGTDTALKFSMQFVELHCYHASLQFGDSPMRIPRDLTVFEWLRDD